MIRRTILKALPKRSGGHPDFQHPGYYKHKRTISFYETNLWVYDGVQPEYLFDFISPYVTGPTMVFRTVMFTLVLPFIGCWIIKKIVYPFWGKPFISQYVDSPDSNITKMLRRFRNEKVFARKHPLGHVHTPSYETEGWIPNSEHFLYKKFKV